MGSNADDMCLSKSEMDDIMPSPPPSSFSPLIQSSRCSPFSNREKNAEKIQTALSDLTLIDLEQKTYEEGHGGAHHTVTKVYFLSKF